MSYVRCMAAAIVLLLMAGATAARAGGFYLKEQSPAGLGRAFAGETALGADASTVFYNPAGMTELHGFTATAGLYALQVDSRQHDQGTTRTVPGLPVSLPVTGSDGGNPFDQPLASANLYLAAPVYGDDLWAGLGVNSPFGLGTDYRNDFFARYDSLTSKLFTTNFQPSLAYRLTPRFSVGAGFDIQYANVELLSALPNLDPALPDGGFRVKGDDWSLGWNIGIHADFGQVRLGAHYRSGIEYSLRGNLKISGLLGPLAPQNGTVGVSAPLLIPDIVSAGIVYEMPDIHARLLGDITWFNWSDFKEIRITTSTGETFTTPQNYKDTWSFAAGGEYDWTERLTVRAGVQYDETPTRDAFRTTRVPDGNRWWLAGGATYDLSERFNVSLSYAHVFVSTEPIHRTDAFYEGTPAQVDATILSRNTGAANIFALGVTVEF